MDRDPFLSERTEDQIQIKKELDSDDPLAATETRLIFTEPNTKCGEILLGHKGTFTIVCALCADCFRTLEELGVHIQEEHISLKELVSIEEIFVEDSQYKEFIKPEPIDGDASLNYISSTGIKAQTLARVSTNEICSSRDSVSKQKSVVCKLCTLAFTDRESYLSHAKRVHVILTPRMRKKLRRQVKNRKRKVSDNHTANVSKNRAESETCPRQEDIFPCPMCTCCYSHKRSLTAHIRKKHENCTSYQLQCTNERDKLKENNSLNLIRSTSEGDEPIEDVETVKNTSKSAHTRTKKEIKIFSCPLCTKSYSHRRSLVSHLRKKHNKHSIDEFPDVPPYSAETNAENREISPCHLCKRVFSRKSTLECHIKRIHQKKSSSSSNVCRYCDKRFETHQALQIHITDDHPGDRKYLCPYCPKLFKCNTTRRGHIYTHTGERPFKCPHCAWAFSSSSNLKMHIKVHLHIKKFPCSWCGKMFITGSEARRHERIHTGEKSHQCEECGKRYDSLFKLKEHHLRHKDIRNHECKVCAKRFYTSIRLRDHMATHTGERPFSCTVCGQNFPRRRALKVHEQLHSGVKKYVCPTCGKAFAQFAGLYSHRKSHNNAVEPRSNEAELTETQVNRNELFYL